MQQITAYKTIDGKLFDTEQNALDHERLTAFCGVGAIHPFGGIAILISSRTLGQWILDNRKRVAKLIGAKFHADIFEKAEPVSSDGSIPNAAQSHKKGHYTHNFGAAEANRKPSADACETSGARIDINSNDPLDSVD